MQLQVASRVLQADFVFSFVNDAVLLARRGVTAATGNWYCGLLESGEMGFLLHALRRDAVFLEIGANVGSYSVLAGGGAVGARVLAVEPIATACAYLKKNVLLNGLSERVQVQRVGVSSRSDTLPFTNDLGAMNRVALPHEVQESVSVAVTTLDDLCQEFIPDFIKVDVEGHESKVLEGGQRTLCSPVVQPVVLDTNGSGLRYGVEDTQVVERMTAFGFVATSYDVRRREVRPWGRCDKNAIFLEGPSGDGAQGSRCAALYAGKHGGSAILYQSPCGKVPIMSVQKETKRVGTRVAIVQKRLPPYRMTFFQLLSEALTRRGVEMRLFYGTTLGGDREVDVAWATKLRPVSTRLRLRGIEDVAMILPGLPKALESFRPDLVIAEDLGGLPNSMMVAEFCRTHRVPYLIWGLGKIPGRKSSLLRKVLWLPIKRLYGGASGFVCYSTHAERVYSCLGKETFVAHNATLRACDVWAPEDLNARIHQRYESEVLRVVTVGVLGRQKRFDVLVDAFGKLRGSPFRLDIIGDGPERQALAGQVRNTGLTDCVKFHGPLYDQREKQDIFVDAHIGVLPGRGGLAIQEMMGSAVPVISGVADGTEADLLTNGKNGFLLSGEPTAGEIASCFRQFASMSLEEKASMAHAALRRVRDEINVEAMVQMFERAIFSRLSTGMSEQWQE